ncbi:MAG: TlpA family protein disulfide reductase [Bacteroidota bacterium]|nr:TlpA family protein disulfide reductase [Bacteroidota bacterium]
MKLIYCLMILLWPFVSIGQMNKPLTIGDKVPDITITNLLNSGISFSEINAYKGKILILDFMSTGCVPCIKILPLLDSLQIIFDNQIQIVLVTSETPQRVQSFLKRNPDLKLPIVAEDSNLSKLFPHVYISHIVWINGAGIVKGMTHSEYINAKNIDAVLQGQHLNWPVKRDVADYDFKQPLLNVNENNIPEFSLPKSVFYTSMVNYMPGVQKYSEISLDNLKKRTHVSLINYRIIDFYLLLFQRFNFPMSHVSLQIKDKDRLVYNPANGYYEDWVEKNFYCMDAMLPGNISWPLQQEKLIDDCNFYFGLQGKMQKRTVDCLVLRNKNSSAINTKNERGAGLRVGMITHLLNNEVGTTPVIDETTGTTYVTIPITEQQLTDKGYLRKMLGQYGLELIPEKRELEFLVVTEP